nr:hypothetical protein GTC16762_31290 [Pigmentibacter ruber]
MANFFHKFKAFNNNFEHIESLIKGEIYFSNIHSLNDPHELKYTLFRMVLILIISCGFTILILLMVLVLSTVSKILIHLLMTIV